MRMSLLNIDQGKEVREGKESPGTREPGGVRGCCMSIVM